MHKINFVILIRLKSFYINEIFYVVSINMYVILLNFNENK